MIQNKVVRRIECWGASVYEQPRDLCCVIYLFILLAWGVSNNTHIKWDQNALTSTSWQESHFHRNNGRGPPIQFYFRVKWIGKIIDSSVIKFGSKETEF